MEEKKPFYCFCCMERIDENCKICPRCGQPVYREAPVHHLQPGTVLNGKYLVGKVLGEGGFGITYIGRDTVLDLKIAIKEYYPNGYANRNTEATNEVTISVSTATDYYAKGKERFLQEARILAKFSHDENIVNVRDFFELNNTAYIIMEYLAGENLGQYIKKNGRQDPVKLVQWFIPILKVLQKVHNQGMVHRDISPDNIIVEDGRLVLIDFGAARALESNKSLSVVLKPGYAPGEQYYSHGKQGPWTDIYAICATMYKCITGVTPPESSERIFEDRLVAPSAMGIAVPEYIETAILKGLSNRFQERQQNMDTLILELTRVNSVSGHISHLAADESEEKERPKTKIEPQKSEPRTVLNVSKENADTDDSGEDIGTGGTIPEYNATDHAGFPDADGSEEKGQPETRKELESQVTDPKEKGGKSGTGNAGRAMISGELDDQKPDKKNKWLIPGIAVAAVALICGGVMLFRKKPVPPVPDNTVVETSTELILETEVSTVDISTMIETEISIEESSTELITDATTAETVRAEETSAEETVAMTETVAVAETIIAEETTAMKEPETAEKTTTAEETATEEETTTEERTTAEEETTPEVVTTEEAFAIDESTTAEQTTTIEPAVSAETTIDEVPAAENTKYAYDTADGQSIINNLYATGGQYTSCEYDDMGRVLSKIWYLPNGHFSLRYEYVYDDSKHSISSTEYRENGTARSTMTFQCDENWKPQTAQKYDNAGELNYSRIYYYGQDGNLEKTERFSPEGVLQQRYLYDQYGNMLQHLFYDEKGEEYRSYTMEYDERQDRVKETYILYGTVVYSYTSAYDSDHCRTEITYYHGDGSFNYRLAFSPNLQNLETAELTLFNWDGSEYSKTTEDSLEKLSIPEMDQSVPNKPITYDANAVYYVSTYDDQDRITERTWYDELGTLSQTASFAYDEDSYTIRSNHTRKDGEDNGWREITCDKEWKWLEADRYNANGKQSATTEYLYDENGLLCLSVQKNSKGNVVETSSFDHYGNTVKRMSWSSEGNPKYEEEGLYDGRGNQIQWTKRDVDGNQMYRYESKYDDQNYRTELSWYNAEDRLLYRIVFSPNLQNCETAKLITYDSKGEEVSSVTVEDPAELELPEK